jgi:2-oxoglutarate dehydrogenase E1 component
MSDLRAFFGPNAGYVLEMYEQYLADPASVDAETQAFFADFDPSAIAYTPGRAPATTVAAAPVQPAVDVLRATGAARLAKAIRSYGHLAANLDPLNGPKPEARELLPEHHGLTEADLANLPASIVWGPLAEGAANAAEAIARLRTAYCGASGFEFDHVPSTEERVWLRNAVEAGTYAAPLQPDEQRALLRRLTAVEGFERFLHQTYLGQKRFSVEGNDIVVPMLDEIVRRAASDGVKQVVIGMAHRGRLNVLTHILRKRYADIIAQFEGKKRKPAATAASDPGDEWTGDVKYHLGARSLPGERGQLVELPIVLAPNPSHLEQVNPVVVGMVRASQDIRNQGGAPYRDPSRSVGVLIHGDAAFPGQGVVTETMNLAGLEGYTTSGTVHIIVNNQIGFTTNAWDSRSTLYASDPAKGFEIPIIHVNADEPEACLAATRLALAFRQRYGKDVLIDLIGYRRWGHNEGDEPGFTQPKMYEQITKHPTVRELWARRLSDSNVTSIEEADRVLKEKIDELAGVRRSITDGTFEFDDEPVADKPRQEVETALTEDQLREYQIGIHAVPEGFELSSKLARQWQRRAGAIDGPDARIDWAHAEALAFAATVSEGIPVRLTGQDAERGTFSQRHLVLHDPKDGQSTMPLQTLPTATASFAAYNSPLSEAACVGFEYGYAVQAPETLVLWEGQFGDFANGAQIMIDQFISAARSKWQQEPGLVMLLPHGYEGQGPEHSSARLERFLQLVAQDNLRVANCTTSAQYFHLLRRQAKLLAVDRRPLIVMTPKSLLRNPLASSPVADLTQGTFRPVIDDVSASDRREAVTRLVLCSGKVIVDLEGSSERPGAENVAVARVEQLAPFQNTLLRAVISSYPNLQEVVWVQEEPKNMGAWTYMEPRLRELTGDQLPIRYIGRPERASPAEGSLATHNSEQARIVAAAYADAPALKPANGRGKQTNGSKQSANADAAVSMPQRATKRS